MTAWVLIIFLHGATSVDMHSREACSRAAEDINRRTRMFASCIHRGTGEVVR